MRKFVVGVMGPGLTATPEACALAHTLGGLIAAEGWAVLTGGRNAGVMNAASQGARERGGLTIGVIPNKDPAYVSEYVDVPIYTDMGLARNNVNVISSDVIVAISSGTSLGTTSEVALALNHERDVIFLDSGPKCIDLFREMAPDRVFVAENPARVIELIQGRKQSFSAR